MNPHAHLRCRRCDDTYALDIVPATCSACAIAGQRGVLEVEYDYDRIVTGLPRRFWTERGRSIWQYAPLLPAGSEGAEISLGEGNTPLIRSRSIGAQIGLEHLYFKNESINPTWSHKDRCHAVSITIARALGYLRVVTSSTGNHGASAAAYARRAGLEALVLCPPETSPALLHLIQSFGARVIVTEWDAREDFGRWLVAHDGWYPATTMDPDFSFHPNPFGVEGYKTIAYELIRDLGVVPDRIFVPCAGGDTFYGIWKGFKELMLLGLIDRLPRMYGCQPARANALKLTLQSGGQSSVILERPHSIATSVRERSVGLHAVEVVRESRGGAPTATDEEILEAMRWLGHEGLVVEPASALPLACAAKLARSGEIDPSEVVVCLLTAAGIKWPDTLAELTGQPPYVEPTIEALREHLEALR
jgi:threonine synthase